MKSVTVLYEDQGVPQVSNYGPHILALACVCDTLSSTLTPWELGKSCRGVPLKGAGNVTKRLALMDGALKSSVLALLDLDRIEELLGLPPETTESDLQAKANAIAPNQRILFLKQNLETVFDVATGLLGRPRPIGKPTPAERDTVMHALAHHADPTLRAKLSERVPTWGAFVQALVECLGLP